MGNDLCLTFSVVFMTVVATLILNGSVTFQSDCPNRETYEPCKCFDYDFEFSFDIIHCDGLIQDFVAVFKRTTPSNLRELSLLPSPDNAPTYLMAMTIPKNLLNEHQVKKIKIFSPNNSYSLRIDPDTFRFSKNFTQEFLFQDWDFSGLNFNFLAGFVNLSKLSFSRTSNVHLANWTSMPLLPNLKVLDIYDSTGLNDWDTFPSSLIRGLEILSLISNEIQNAPMDRILNRTVRHSSTTLLQLQLNYNNLTSIPLQIPAFVSLKRLDIAGQKNGIQTIPSGSMKFSNPVSYFDVSMNNITTIEPGAFQGDFSVAFINLFGNQMTRFEELVFKTVLQQMLTKPISEGTLGLYAYGNPFDCHSDPCHLAWLIRDNPKMLAHLDAHCSNGTSFKQLKPSAFIRCGINNSPNSTVRTPVTNVTTKRPYNSSVQPYSHNHIMMAIATLILMY